MKALSHLRLLLRQLCLNSILNPLSDYHCHISPSGFIFIAMDGMSDVVGGGDYGSWNVSKTEGPLGLTCDPQLVGVVL